MNVDSFKRIECEIQMHSMRNPRIDSAFPRDKSNAVGASEIERGLVRAQA